MGMLGCAHSVLAIAMSGNELCCWYRLRILIYSSIRLLTYCCKIDAKQWKSGSCTQNTSCLYVRTYLLDQNKTQMIHSCVLFDMITINAMIKSQVTVRYLKLCPEAINSGHHVSRVKIKFVRLCQCCMVKCQSCEWNGIGSKFMTLKGSFKKVVKNMCGFQSNGLISAYQITLRPELI